MTGLYSICRRSVRHGLWPGYAAVPASFDARQGLLQAGKELLPTIFGALVRLLLLRPEARLLHAQMGSRARRGESPGDDALEAEGRPCIGQRLVRLDGHDLTVD